MPRLRLAIPLALLLALADCTSKALIVDHFGPEHVPHPIVGDFLQFALAYNRGAAMSLPVGSSARWPLVAVSLVALVVLLRLVWTSPRRAIARQIALGLLIGGTIGNGWNRAMSPHGVVDFIDVGFGTTRFWVFNVADMGITVGACLLAYAMWRTTPRGAPDGPA